MAEDRKFIKIQYVNELKTSILRLYTISNFLTTKPGNTNDMEPNQVFSANPDAAANDLSVKRPGEYFPVEKKPLQEKNIQKDATELPAPFYDELHFANYE